MLNQTLANRYTLTAHVGSGAMGTVYRAIDSQTGDEVAVKVLNRELAFSPELLERFRREGEALRQLRHPNIVGLVDSFKHESQQVIVMEYVAGGSLHGLIKQGPLPADRARKIALGLCDALTRAHDLGIIHRDIKPENILVAADGTPKLTDFGIARLLTEGTRITHSGVQVGTPYYMSPEAWEGKPLDAQADIWSLGIVLFEMLAGEVPFPGDTVIAVMHKVLTAPLPELKQTRPDAPEGLAQIVRRMMTRDKAERYQTMREVGLDLERGEPVRAIPSLAAEAKTQPSPVAKRKLSLTKMLLGGFVVLGAGALLLAVFGILAPQFSRFLPAPPQAATQPTPLPTVAPVSPVATLPANTPSPMAAEITSTPTSYFFDNFSDTNGQPYDMTRWLLEPKGIPGDYTFVQEDGRLRLILTSSGKLGGVALHPRPYQDAPLDEIAVFQFNLMLPSDFAAAPAATARMTIMTGRDGRWRAAIWSFEADTSGSTWVKAGIQTWDDHEGWEAWDPKLYDARITADEWHTYRIEVNPEKSEFTFFLDGMNLGTLADTDEAWRTLPATIILNYSTSRASGDTYTVYTDDVFISNTRAAVPPASAPTPEITAIFTFTPSITATLTPTASGTTGTISGTLSIGQQCADGSVHTIFVNAIPVASGPPGYMTRLSAPGTYALSDLPPGSYNVGALMDCDEGPATSGDVSGMVGRTVNVTAGRETSGVDFALGSTAP